MLTAEQITKISEKFFLTIADALYHWEYYFAYDQYKLWRDGVRDGRLHDGTFTVGKMTDKAVEAVVYIA